METYDKAKAARVWQRVQGAAAANPTQGLQGLIAEEWADAALYLALSRRVQGNASAILRKMSQEEQAHLACLKGMYTLQGAGRPEIPTPLPDYEVRELLRQKKADTGAYALLMTTARGLTPIAYGVTGARVLKRTCQTGTALHIVGGTVGLGIMLLLVVLGALELLTPANMFLYQLVWMLPALLITEWTRSI